MEGQIVEWNDAKGYGFIDATTGERRIFLHISAIKERSRRPKVNDKVSFFIRDDEKGRANAVNVTLESAAGLPWQMGFAVLFMLAVIVLVVLGKQSWLWIPAYLLMSIVTFAFFAQDKHAAKRGAWRTPESTLQLFSLFCGWPGALFAQQMLRHKSKKGSFKATLWGCIVINLGAFGWTFTSKGYYWLESLMQSLLA
ncbi:DUF1294 domain-containing protein [Pokkaliibacter sp. CJK22405]|uniref:DUF1294 domain-containing protein n=1 Tax=Pokkaliibacter sp. CJK22405 TaxID=3384615 RepID=UPI00398488D3